MFLVEKNLGRAVLIAALTVAPYLPSSSFLENKLGTKAEGTSFPLPTPSSEWVTGYSAPPLLTSDPFANLTITTTLVEKVFGSKIPDDPSWLPVANDNFKGVTGTDLGIPSVKDGQLYFALGDSTNWPVSGDYKFIEHVFSSAAVAYTDSGVNLDKSFIVKDYLGGAPLKAVEAPGHLIPTALFTVKEELLMHYMDVISTEGNAHRINYAAIAKFDGQKFIPYKLETNFWKGSLGYFAKASFVTENEYLYMLGTAPDRFDGIKAARIALGDFLNEESNSGWQYLLESGWSKPTTDSAIISSARYLINPPFDRSSGINLSWKEQCAKMGIAEFSLVYNPYLARFMLLTSNVCTPDAGGGLYYYLSPSIEGPWSQKYSLPLPVGHQPEKQMYYGIYTTDALLKESGKKMDILVSNWPTYGVYRLEVIFKSSPFPYRDYLPSIRVGEEKNK